MKEAKEASVSKLLKETFSSLAEATTHEDFVDAAQELKKFLEPLRSLKDLPLSERQNFTTHDLEIIGAFWSDLTTVSFGVDATLHAAVRIYGLIKSAGADTTIPALKTEAGVECKRILLLCRRYLPKCSDQVVLRLPDPKPKAARLSVVVTPPR